MAKVIIKPNPFPYKPIALKTIDLPTMSFFKNISPTVGSMSTLLIFLNFNIVIITKRPAEHKDKITSLSLLFFLSKNVCQDLNVCQAFA